MKMILVSTLLCDRKASSQLTAIPRMAELTYPDKTLYVNVQTDDFDRHFGPLKGFLASCPVKCHLDIWSFRSTWWSPPTFDQDTARLTPIVMGRNMSLTAALALGASHILQIDADVVPPPDSIERLLRLDHPIVGGIVGGRGAHGAAVYVFHERGPVPSFPGVVECGFGTAGFMLIQRSVFNYLRYRWGPSSIDPNVMLSEDPAFCEDAFSKWGFGSMWLDKGLRAEHRDDPLNPLTVDGTRAAWPEHLKNG